MLALTFDTFFREHRQRLEALHRSADAARWSVSLADFAQAAFKGVASAAQTGPREVRRLLDALRAPDLALALGCAQGNERAWETFCSEYRSVLYDAAYSLTHEESQARELADSLLAELYGLDPSGAGRNSRFAYFHGRSSLKTWLRAVLYQRFVDEYRRRARLEPLLEGPAEPTTTASSVSEEDDRRYANWLGEAVDAALSELRAPEKLLLSYYYVQELTLKQIGQLTGEHEATISRHLEILRKKLRKRIEAFLRSAKKLSAFEIDRCLDSASRGVSVNLEKVLKPD